MKTSIGRDQELAVNIGSARVIELVTYLNLSGAIAQVRAGVLEMR